MKKVTVSGLVKTYGTKKAPVKAVDSVSFEVENGELFGIIGPDGAGKTSIFRVLTTLLLPDGGSALVDGLDVVKDFRAIRNRVGYMPGRFSLYPDLTVEENLEFFATVFNTSIREKYDLIKDIYIHIEPFKNRPAGKLSGGMKQKLALCCAFIHQPVILFLDEPTTGVDAVSRKEFWEMLKGLQKRGITILVSTPYMDEADLCDRIALIQEGRLLTIDTPARVSNSFAYPIYAARSNHMLNLLHELRKLPGVKDAYSFGEYHHVVLNDEAAAQKIKEEFAGTGVEFFPVKAGIEDSFMNLMQKK